MDVRLWLVIGILLTVMALAGTVIKRLPLSTSLLYLLVGIGLGTHGLGLLWFDPVEQASMLELITEIVVLVSLFSAGLKLRLPFSNARWWIPVRLATVSMLITVGLITLVGLYGLGLSLGGAVLLGAILAPTDPVLASDVQVNEPSDSDRLRFGLTGEAGFNDGTAFPFMLLGLGLLGLHDLGPHGWRWWLLDVVWAGAGGIAIGALLGNLVGRLILYLRRMHQQAVGTDDYLTLGLIALSYGAAVAAHAGGFLAVFAAGLALRHIEANEAGINQNEAAELLDITGQEEEVAVDPEKAPAFLAHTMLSFDEKLERIGEIAIVMLLGSSLSTRWLVPQAIWFVPLLFLVIRPLSVWLGLAKAKIHTAQRSLIGWFGIRGIGSIYYLTYAISHRVPVALAERLTGLTLCTVTVSIVVHGISVTPLMTRYETMAERRRVARAKRQS